MRCVFVSFGLILLYPAGAQAHPVPKGEHDRHITVRLKPGDKPDWLLLQIDYRLEVDQDTVVLDDLKPFRDEIDGTLFRKDPLGFFAQFTRLYAPVLAGNVLVKINGKDVELTCSRREQRLSDEKGEVLGHLRCDFAFEASIPVMAGENVLSVRESNYLLQAGQIHLRFANESAVTVVKQTAPPEDLLKKQLDGWQPPDDNVLRDLKVTFVPAERETPAVQSGSSSPLVEPKHSPPPHDLLTFYRRTDVGFALLLLIFAGLGAVHALTPGHGKTLVAAYLVGQRGTAGHAVFLGVITTLTHTGIVLLLAAALLFMPEHMSASARQTIHTGLGLVMGLGVTCLGFWLLLQRLSGRADHFHLGGHGHHHHGHDHHHPHGHHHSHLHDHGDDFTHTRAGGERLNGVGWSSLVILGITGGLIPCWDAVVILVASVGAGEFGLALPLILAFSAGLAATLVLIGILVVNVRNFAGSRWGEGRLVRALPILSAGFITGVGFWLCYESLRVAP